MSFIKIFVNAKEVQQQDEWDLKWRVGEEIDFPIYVLVGFQQRKMFKNNYSFFASFYRPSAFFAQSNTETETYPERGINSDYRTDESSRGYSKILSC